MDIRLLGRLTALFGIALLATIVLLVLVWAKADDATNRVRTDVASVKVLAAELKLAVQSPTHSHDIGIWCNAINGIEGEIVAHHNTVLRQSSSTPAVPYHFHALPCAQLEARETASQHTKH